WLPSRCFNVTRLPSPVSRLTSPVSLQMPSQDFKRTDRVAAQLRREVAVLVHAAVRDHALPSVSVSDVEVNRELDTANVYVTALVGEEGPVAVRALNELARDFRRELS